MLPYVTVIKKVICLLSHTYEFKSRNSTKGKFIFYHYEFLYGIILATLYFVRYNCKNKVKTIQFYIFNIHSSLEYWYTNNIIQKILYHKCHFEFLKLLLVAMSSEFYVLINFICKISCFVANFLQAPRNVCFYLADVIASFHKITASSILVFPVNINIVKWR